MPNVHGCVTQTDCEWSFQLLPYLLLLLSVKHNHCGSFTHWGYLADHQRGTCTLRGIRRRFVLKVEGLARLSKHAEKTTTSSDRGV